MSEVQFRNVKIQHLSHAAFKLEGAGIVVYIDPFSISLARSDGDIGVCTHDHFDHCSPDDLRKVLKADAVIVAAANCEKKLHNLKRELKLLKPGEEVLVKGIKIQAVPAYNVNKPYHPRGYGGIGVIVEIAGVRIYHAGDTDLIPEMERLRGKVDVALLPVSGTYVMTAEEAAEAARRIKPALAIPMHYGAIVGSVSDAERFRKLVEGLCEVAII